MSRYRLSHGKAVAAGMIVAAKLSNRIGKLSESELKRHNQLIKKIIKIDIPKYSAKEVMAKMEEDKKRRNGKMNFVLLEGIGNAVMEDDIPTRAIIEALEYD